MVGVATSKRDHAEVKILSSGHNLQCLRWGNDLILNEGKEEYISFAHRKKTIYHTLPACTTSRFGLNCIAEQFANLFSIASVSQVLIRKG